MFYLKIINNPKLFSGAQGTARNLRLHFAWRQTGQLCHWPIQCWWCAKCLHDRFWAMQALQGCGKLGETGNLLNFDIKSLSNFSTTRWSRLVAKLDGAAQIAMDQCRHTDDRTSQGRMTWKAGFTCEFPLNNLFQINFGFFQAYRNDQRCTSMGHTTWWVSYFGFFWLTSFQILDRDEIYQRKQAARNDVQNFLTGCPDEYADLLQLIDGLQFADEPNYAEMTKILEKVVGFLG